MSIKRKAVALLLVLLIAGLWGCTGPQAPETPGPEPSTPAPENTTPPPVTPPATEPGPLPGPEPQNGATPEPKPAPEPSPAPPPGITITAPAAGGVFPQGDSIVVSVAVTNFTLADKPGQPAVSGEGHIHYFLDVDPPVAPGQPATTAPGTFAASAGTSFTWGDLTPGKHVLSVELVNNDRTPLDPPVVASVSIEIVGESPPEVPPEPAPVSGENFFGPAGIDILDIAVASDGKTIYAAARSNASNRLVYKSVNSGISWKDLSGNSGLSIAGTSLIAVAPDNPDIVVVADALTPAVFISVNGGDSWAPAGAIAAARLYDIDISAQSNGIRYVAAAGTLNPGDNNAPALFYFDLGTAVPRWRDAVRDFNGLGGNNLAVNEIDAIRAVAFSPAFAADMTLTAVSEQTGTAVKDGAMRFHQINMSSRNWDTDAGFAGSPVLLESSSGINFSVGHASISLDPEYLAINPFDYAVFIGAQITDGTNNREAGGIYRVYGNARLKILDAPAYSVAFNGTKLVAGATTDGAGTPSHTVYYSLNPLSNMPSFNEGQALKRPSGTTAVVVAWAGNKVVAGTSGGGSAFSVSENDGESFNAISLIDKG